MARAVDYVCHATRQVRAVGKCRVRSAGARHALAHAAAELDLMSRAQFAVVPAVVGTRG